jgi:hypothetical protein
VHCEITIIIRVVVVIRAVALGQLLVAVMAELAHTVILMTSTVSAAHAQPPQRALGRRAADAPLLEAPPYCNELERTAVRFKVRRDSRI